VNSPLQRHAVRLRGHQRHHLRPAPTIPHHRCHPEGGRAVAASRADSRSPKDL